MKNYDFCGWATRNNVRCSDGRTIMKDAFKHNDGTTVPLVWNHQHNTPDNVLGHALLENRDEGVYAYCSFNNTDYAQYAKELVQHGDIKQLSIYANQLKQQKNPTGADVLHGVIREVSLVYASANPEAYIENFIRHSDDGQPVASEEEVVIYTGEEVTLSHAEEEKAEQKQEAQPEQETNKEAKQEETKVAEVEKKNEKTVKEIYDEMTEEQKTVVHVLVGEAIEQNKSEGGDKEVKHNVFEQEEEVTGGALSHSTVEAIFGDAKRYGSLKDSFFAHAGDTEHAEVTQNYGINGADFLFPDAKNVSGVPQFIQRDMGWVQKVMKAVHHTPFSKIKSIFANITEEDARAKGYIKGKVKKDEFFALMKRSTTPTTVYKKQKLDRDDVVDITDFDVVAWLKGEMRMMLDEELARAFLVGDGRPGSSDDKINEQNIRPIWTDEDLYTIKKVVETGSTADETAKNFIRAAIKARKDYKGSGTPTLYTTEDVLTDMLLIEDSTGHVIYDSEAKLATALRVKEIVTVPVLEGLTRQDDGKTKALMGIIVNLADYNVGADKGGAVNMFDDFDIDYNQQKYLIETRCSGALVKPYAAIALETINA